MEIKYTYADEKIPIRKAEFRIFGGAVEVEILDDADRCGVKFRWLSGLNTATFDKSDWKDFAALVNRINMQING